MKKDIESVNKIFKQMVKKAHMDAQHKSSGSRLKSIIGLQKTSIGMFLDSLLEQYKKGAPKKDHNKKDIEEIMSIMHKRQDIWDKYQKGGEYPATLTYVLILMIESYSGEKTPEKNKNKAAKEMLEEIEFSGLE
tara:strand:+ start:327 stop:728 length:402 start_codon:yes stop_codon:yes gene_type:complete